MAIPYNQKSQHRHKCMNCGQLIQDGDMIDIITTVKEKYYPVKGIMRFTVYHFKHINCNR